MESIYTKLALYGGKIESALVQFPLGFWLVHVRTPHPSPSQGITAQPISGPNVKTSAPVCYCMEESQSSEIFLNKQLVRFSKHVLMTLCAEIFSFSPPQNKHFKTVLCTLEFQPF